MNMLAENRRARFDYDLLETIEAGVELLGHEVKSVRAGQLNLAGSYALLRGGEAWLLNASIPPYQPRNTPPDYDPKRTRRLLLQREEIARLAGKLKEKYSLIPINAHVRNRRIKIELGVARARKKQDKRELLKKRAMENEMRREAA